MGAHLREQVPLRAGPSEQSEAQLREGDRARSVNREPMNEKGIEGTAEQASNHKAHVIKAKWCKSGGCAVKECILTWGDLALWVKARWLCWSEKPAEVARAASAGTEEAARAREDRRASDVRVSEVCHGGGMGEA